MEPLVRDERAEERDKTRLPVCQLLADVDAAVLRDGVVRADTLVNGTYLAEKSSEESALLGIPSGIGHDDLCPRKGRARGSRVVERFDQSAGHATSGVEATTVVQCIHVVGCDEGHPAADTSHRRPGLEPRRGHVHVDDISRPDDGCDFTSQYTSD